MEEGSSFWMVVLIVAIIYLWSSNSSLKDKVRACAYEIDNANQSISDANDEIQEAKDDAWSDYETMGSTLENLNGDYQESENPCDPTWNGDMSTYDFLKK